jgi:hypothetical protein
MNAQRLTMERQLFPEDADSLRTVTRRQMSDLVFRGAVPLGLS